jgi:hypothetical protein
MEVLMKDREILTGIYDESIDNEWMFRVDQEIKDKHLQRPESIYNSSFYTNSALKYVHRPHIDPSDPNKIRYVSSIADGRKSRMSSMRIGRYLTKHFKDSIGSEAEVLATQQQIVYETAPVVVKVAMGEDDIQWVFDNGPRSCMSKRASDFQVPTHPCRSYSAGDLGIAYILDAEEKKATARAVVWMAKKGYSRIYGDNARLKRGLEQLGYSPLDTLLGARLKKTPFAGTYIVPYIDGHARYLQDIEGQDHFVIQDSKTYNRDIPVHEIGSEWGWLWQPVAEGGPCYIGEQANVRQYCGGSMQQVRVTATGGNRLLRTICLAHRETPTISNVDGDNRGPRFSNCSACGHIFRTNYSVNTPHTSRCIRCQ